MITRMRYYTRGWYFGVITPKKNGNVSKGYTAHNNELIKKLNLQKYPYISLSRDWYLMFKCLVIYMSSFLMRRMREAVARREHGH